mgnify:CR=1 FL=1
MTATAYPQAQRFSRSDYKTLGLAALGGALEIYDFIIFVFFATVVGKLFFPADMPEWLRLMQTFGIFAASGLDDLNTTFTDAGFTPQGHAPYLPRASALRMTAIGKGELAFLRYSCLVDGRRARAELDAHAHQLAALHLGDEYRLAVAGDREVRRLPRLLHEPREVRQQGRLARAEQKE